MAVGRTKQGFVMREWIRRRVVEVLANPAHECLPRVRQAELVGVGSRTLRDYMTEDVMAEVARMREGAVSDAMLRDVDRAMVLKAAGGDVGACGWRMGGWWPPSTRMRLK